MKKVCIALAVALCLSGCDGDPAARAVISKAEFDKIQIGMSLVEVQEIIGDPGAQIGVTELMGIKNESYQWQNEDGGNAILMFENGKLTSKNQAGLP